MYFQWCVLVRSSLAAFGGGVHTHDARRKYHIVCCKRCDLGILGCETAPHRDPRLVDLAAMGLQEITALRALTRQHPHGSLRPPAATKHLSQCQYIIVAKVSNGSTLLSSSAHSSWLGAACASQGAARLQCCGYVVGRWAFSDSQMAVASVALPDC